MTCVRQGICTLGRVHWFWICISPESVKSEWRCCHVSMSAMLCSMFTLWKRCPGLIIPTSYVPVIWSVYVHTWSTCTPGYHRIWTCIKILDYVASHWYFLRYDLASVRNRGSLTFSISVHGVVLYIHGMVTTFYVRLCVCDPGRVCTYVEHAYPLDRTEYEHV